MEFHFVDFSDFLLISGQQLNDDNSSVYIE
jgi:hypothetical protein